MAKFEKFKFYGNDYDKNSYVGFGWYIFADEASSSTEYHCVPTADVRHYYNDEIDYCMSMVKATFTTVSKAKEFCEKNKYIYTE